MSDSRAVKRTNAQVRGDNTSGVHGMADSRAVQSTYAQVRGDNTSGVHGMSDSRAVQSTNAQVRRTPFPETLDPPLVANVYLYGDRSSRRRKMIEIRNHRVFVCLFCCFTSQVNSYGHGRMVSSPYHTFSWASLKKQLTSTSCTHFRLKLTTTLLELISRREENDRRNYFMINLCSMEPGWSQTRDPWICSQTRICCQTHYRLCYAAL